MTYHYTMCGLDYVHLVNGYSIEETEYGPTVSIERADDLDRAIAIRVMISHARLRGQEMRFLRSLLQFSQNGVASHLGVQRVTVARWESGPTTPIPGPADRMIRMIAIQKLFGDDCLKVVMGMLPEITDNQTAPLYLTYVHANDTPEPSLFPDPSDDDGWKPVKAVRTA